MSRILRRPMFRGGRVDSRGTGITSGLDNRVQARDGLFVKGADILAANQGNTIPGLKLNPKSIYTMGSNPAFNQLMKAAAFDVERYEPVGKAGAISDTASLTDFYKSQSGADPESFDNMVAYEDMDFGKDKVEDKVEEKKEPNVITGEEVDIDSDTTVGQTDLQDMISRYEELLGGGKARQRDVGDILGRASAAFLGAGDVREGLAEFMKAESQAGPSRTEKIKQAAAMLGIKGEQAKELYETKLAGQTGQTQKAVEYISRITGKDERSALKDYLRKESTFAETAGKYKAKEGVLTDQGFALAAEEFFEDNYIGDIPTDGNVNVGDNATNKSDGVYTDKVNKIIFEIKDQVVTASRKY
jgi:hypothetical protein